MSGTPYGGREAAPPREKSQAARESVSVPIRAPLSWRRLGRFVLFEVAFLLAYRSGMSFSHDLAAPFWFPDSVLLCALLLSPRREWWIYLLGPLPIRMFLFVPDGAPLWFLVACFFNDSAKGLLAAWLLRSASRRREWFGSLREFSRYLLVAVLLVPILSAFLGAGSRIGVGDDYWTAWKHWFLGDAIANLVLTPFLLCCLGDYKRFLRQSPMRYAQVVLIVAGLGLTAHLAFYRGLESLGDPPFLLYLPLPFLLWAALGFGPRGASCTLCLLNVLAIYGTIAGRGPFHLPSADASLLSIQLFLFFVSFPFLLLAVINGQKRRTEAALRESEERFRTMADTAPVMVWISGVDALCTFYNKPWLDFTGRPLREQLGNGWIENVHPDDRESCQRRYLSAFAARKTFTLEYRVRRSDGAYRWIIDYGLPRYAPDGAFRGYIGTCVDLTDRREAEEELRRVSAQLIQAQESERFRIGQELHDDLAQRVAAISIGLCHLERKYAGNEDLERDFGGLQQQALDVCKDVARLSHQLRPATLERLGLPVALRNLCDQATTGERIVLFSHEEDFPQLGEIVSVSLYRIAQEALRNALTHSGAAHIDILLSASPSRVDLSVTDDGCGFDVGSTLNPGLGLSGMAERMKNVGGSLTVVSSPDEGTTITAAVPIPKDVGPATWAAS